VVAFEPIVHGKIEAAERLYVVPAAVSIADGVSTMRVLGSSGLSSSLAQPSKVAMEVMAEKSSDRSIRLVPVLAMKSVLDSLQQQIVFMKTDMQGFDFQTLQSAGRQLAERVHYIHSEVFYDGGQSYTGGVLLVGGEFRESLRACENGPFNPSTPLALHGFRSTPSGVSNDFCKDWLPHMLGIGYELVTMYGRHKYADDGAVGPNAKHAMLRSNAQAVHYCKGRHPRRSYAEGEAYWRLNGTAQPAPIIGWVSQG
jgi:hypothetical protein